MAGITTSSRRRTSTRRIWRKGTTTHRHALARICTHLHASACGSPAACFVLSSRFSLARSLQPDSAIGSESPMMLSIDANLARVGIMASWCHFVVVSWNLPSWHTCQHCLRAGSIQSQPCLLYERRHVPPRASKNQADSHCFVER